MLLAIAPLGTPALASRTPSNWAVPEMVDANTSGLLTPSAASDFHRYLTRDEFCELVVEMVEMAIGEPLPVPAYNPFVDDTDPISIHALKAWKFEIITGITTTYFAPEDNIEREQLCAMMIRAIRGLERTLGKAFLRPGVETLPYRDSAKIRDYAVDAVKIAYTNGIMHGNDYGDFLPRDNITSQECVAVIIRSYNRIEDTRISGMPNSQLIDMAFDRVHIGYAYGESSFGVSQNITLPAKSTGNATITWTSSDNSIIGIAGELGIVSTVSSAKTVTITARISVGNFTRSKEFKVTTSPHSGDRLQLDNALSELDILYLNEGDGADSVTGNIGLPTKVLGLPVSWRSNNPSVVSTTGYVNVPSGIEPRSATLTATITLGSQTRTKTFNLTVLSPDFSRGVMLHDIYFGLSQSQVSQSLGTVRRTITASSSETWQLYYSSNYSNFIAVGFNSNRAVAVFSMASNAANQLRNRDKTIITVSQANAYGGVSAVSCTDPGDSSKQYAILIYDSTSAIGKSRTLLADGQEQFLFELVNAFRAKNGRSTLEWSDRLGTPARAHSTNRGAGSLRDRVIATSNGFDSGHYIGGNIVSGDNDALEAFDQIIDDYSGSSSMRSQILQSSATLFGAGFSGGNSGTVKTYYTYAIGNPVAITGVTGRIDGSVVSTVNVSAGSTATVALTMSPSGFNETFTVTSSDTRRMTVKTTTTTTGATVTVTGVANGSADIIVTGNSSGKTYSNIKVTVSAAVYATSLTLNCLSKEIYKSGGTNEKKTCTRTLVMGVNDSLPVTASTTSGAVVEWRADGTAASVTRASNNRDGNIKASGTAGTVKIIAKVMTGSSTFIEHTINVRVITAQVTVTPNPVTQGNDITATSALGTLPTTGTGVPTSATPVNSWSVSSDNRLKNKNPSQTLSSATFSTENVGTATVTYTATWEGTAATSYLGKITRTSPTITIQAPQVPTDFTLSNSELSLYPGETINITASIVPSTITQGCVFEWISNNSVLVESEPGSSNSAIGTIKAKGIGKVDITVILKHNGIVIQSKTIKITVSWPEITISGPSPIQIGSETPFIYSCSIPDGYSIEWTCEAGSDGGAADIVSETTDSVSLNPTSAGRIRISAELKYNSGSTNGDVITRTITITDPASG